MNCKTQWLKLTKEKETIKFNDAKKIKLEKLKETKIKNEKDLVHYENNCNAYKILLEKNQKEIEELEKEINNAN